MATKKKSISKTKPKARPKPRAAARVKKGDALVCRVCGYRLVVNKACGCATEHTSVCCGCRMARVAAAR